MSAITRTRTRHTRIVSLWCDSTNPERPLIISVDWIGSDGLCECSDTVDVFPRESLTAARSRAAKVASRYSIPFIETPGIDMLLRQADHLGCP